MLGIMLDKIYIDSIDIYAQYGAFVSEGGYNELIAYPSLKSVKSNDWQEEDGIEADLSEPVLDTKEFSMKFVFTGKNYRLGGFIELLSDKAYHTFNFKEIGRTYRLMIFRWTATPIPLRQARFLPTEIMNSTGVS